MSVQVPRWLDRLERPLGWIAIPNLALILVSLQGMGFLMMMSDPSWVLRLALDPQAVMRGEVWRLITFLALPISTSPLWIVIALWFLWFLLDAIEESWGAFRTTFYVLMSWVLTVGFSLVFDFPVTSVQHLESTLFLAAACLFPEMEVSLFFLVPVKMKWLAWLNALMVGLALWRADWVERLYLGVVYSNFLVFFWPALISEIRRRGRPKWGA